MTIDPSKLKTQVPLSDIYQEVILDHNKNPRNFSALPDSNRHTHGYNPLCGDDYNLYLKVNPDGTIEKASFQGTGCAISKASASMLTTSVKGKKVAEAEALKDKFLKLVTCGEYADTKELGSLRAFQGVRMFPVRVKCATMIWHALEEALKTQGETNGKR